MSSTGVDTPSMADDCSVCCGFGFLPGLRARLARILRASTASPFALKSACCSVFLFMSASSLHAAPLVR